jgi:hypothetical protein
MSRDRNISATVWAIALDPLPGDPFDALGDPHRRAIVELLAAAGDRSVQQIADAGTRRLYRLHDEGIAAVRAYLEQVWGDVAARFRLAAENTREP